MTTDPAPVGNDAAPRPIAPSQRRTARRVLVADAVAGFVVRGGGILVIVAVLGILAFLLATVLPLFRAAEVRELPVTGAVPVPGPPRLLAIDEYRVLGLAVADAPEIVWFRLDTAEPVFRFPVPGLEGGVLAAASRTVRTNDAVLATTDGRVAFLEVGFDTDFVVDERAAGLRASMGLGEVRTLDDGVVQRVAGGYLRRIRPRATARGTLSLPPDAGRAVAVGYASHGDSGAALVATSTGRLHLARETVTKPPVGDPTREFAWGAVAEGGPTVPAEAFAALVDEEARFGWVVGRAGTFLRIDLVPETAVRRETRVLPVEGDAPLRLTAAGLLIGGRSLVLCDDRGGVSIWSPVPVEGGDGQETRRLHAFPAFPSPVRTVSSGTTRRTLYLGHEDGSVTAAYSVNERILARFEAFPGPVLGIAPGSKDDGLVVLGPGRRYRGYDVHAPHPQTNVQALFLPVRYEGYAQAEYVYQSSAGTDEAEPKLSLTPLVYGTLKGTFYAMLFALPLALLAAVYSARFMHPRVRAVVKPTIEVMASLPSVVLGFVAALVIAPFVADVVPAVLSALLLLPVVAFVAGVAWHGLPDRVKHGVPSAARLGLALLLVSAVCAAAYFGNGPLQRAFFSGPANPAGDFRIWLRGDPGTGTGLPLLRAALFAFGAAAGMWLVPRVLRADLPGLPRAARVAVRAALYALAPGLLLVLAAPLVERWAFGGDFRWFLVGHPDGRGTTFEQTNCLVVGIAMGFAVIPIIYTIAEDALSAIPESLTSAALACGASPWQTAMRVVVPAAAPGLFSASMIGLGRAVGETMIVLMATGGTAIMDPSMFNGFRTLSANVATELSEAPRGETLYRVLFLAALLLFAMTFVVNTLAEIVRLRFRRRFKAL